GEPVRFAFYNVELTGGRVDFDDQAVGRRVHTLRDMHLAVPFLSNLDSQREVKVEPHLAFQFNGSRFDSAAQSTPFAVSRKTDASFKLVDFNLAPYLAYLPDSLPLKLQEGEVQADLRLQFEQQPRMSVRLSGVVQAEKLKMDDRAGQEALAFDGIKLVLDDVRPLEQTAKISALELNAPRLAVSRDARGRINLMGLADARPAPSTSDRAVPAPSPAARAASQPASTAGAPGATPPPAWHLELARLSLKNGALRWTDASVNPLAQPAGVALKDLALEATAVTWPFAADTPPLTFEGSAALDVAAPPVTAEVSRKANVATASTKPAVSKAFAPVAVGPFQFKGSATDRMVELHATLTGVPLSLGGPYLAALLEPRLVGQLSAEVDVAWKAPDALKIDARQLTLDGLALLPAAAGKDASPAAGPLASIRKVQLADANIDLLQRTARIGQLAILQPTVRVEKSRDRRWMFESWMKQAPVTSATPSSSAKDAPPSGSAAKPWQVAVGDLSLEGGDIAVADRAAGGAVAFQVSALQVQIKNLAPGSSTASPLTVSARIGAGQTEPGRLSYRGTLALQPLVAQGQVELRQFPLHAFEPYFGAALNIDIARADTGFKGDLRFSDSTSGPSLKVTGDATLEDFRANSVAGITPTAAATEAAAAGEPAAMAVAARGRELLSWKILNLRGLDVALAPGKSTMVDVKETALTDFYARLIVNENGRINLQDLVKSGDPASTPGAAAGATPTARAASAPADAAVAAIAGAKVGAGAGASARATAPPPLPGASAATPSFSVASRAGPAAIVRFGPISLVNGRVLFSDRFVTPNYTANLSELTGKLSAFSSVAPEGAPQLADLELLGRAEGTASLDIQGKLNPLAKPLALDIVGKVRDLELPPLSPYTVKYVGHGIERGKMSVDVHYVVQPDGQLTATNGIVLNQLTFGEPVAGAPASLPVKLAVALLADRNGVIDLNLPLSGSLNDPQFRIGPVIFKILGNLIVKAVTA
ncbi:MAG: hypothetical protein JWQ88_3613, partial [Rhodoferax sp.]|nr:hypothetical protein [Rhodoferax sp.]